MVLVRLKPSNFTMVERCWVYNSQQSTRSNVYLEEFSELEKFALTDAL